MKHAVVVYFAGWHLGESNARLGGEVAGLPWDKVTHFNHAFWYVEPNEDTEVSSFQRRASGMGARKDFRIVPLSPENDLEDHRESQLVPGLVRSHFAQYAYFARRFPNVRILLSIGGWTKSGFFSEMTYTQEGRASFIASCLRLLDRYPWLGGIDIDWEYPAGSGVERQPDPGDPEDQGCPIFGTAEEDCIHFAALLRELRMAMAQKYGPGVKQLTACCSGSVEGALMHQDWAAAAPHLDLINIMSYDLAGVWGGVADHASSAAQAIKVVHYFQTLGIPTSKLCIGSPLYGTPFRLTKHSDTPLGKPIEAAKPVATELLKQDQLMRWEAEAVSGYEIACTAGHYRIARSFDRVETGWHMGYDQETGGAYLYNDAGSQQDRWFISYENSLSLQRKLQDILENDLGGIIVWEASQDTADARKIGQMYDTLNSTKK